MIVLTMASFVTLMLPEESWNRLTNAIFVLLVALAKASLVVGFFMHYRWEKGWKYVLTLPPLICVLILLVLLLPDIAFPPYPPGKW